MKTRSASLWLVKVVPVLLLGLTSLASAPGCSTAATETSGWKLSGQYVPGPPGYTTMSFDDSGGFVGTTDDASFRDVHGHYQLDAVDGALRLTAGDGAIQEFVAAPAPTAATKPRGIGMKTYPAMPGTPATDPISDAQDLNPEEQPKPSCLGLSGETPGTPGNDVETASLRPRDSDSEPLLSRGDSVALLPGCASNVPLNVSFALPSSGTSSNAAVAESSTRVGPPVDLIARADGCRGAAIWSAIACVKRKDSSITEISVYRSSDEQAKIWRDNGCSTPARSQPSCPGYKSVRYCRECIYVAPPGASSHQQCLAVDFNHDPRASVARACGLYKGNAPHPNHWEL